MLWHSDYLPARRRCGRLALYVGSVARRFVVAIRNCLPTRGGSATLHGRFSGCTGFVGFVVVAVVFFVVVVVVVVIVLARAFFGIKLWTRNHMLFSLFTLI